MFSFIKLKRTALGFAIMGRFFFFPRLLQSLRSQDYVSKKLKQRSFVKNVFLHQVETDSPWIRDYGPIFLLSEIASVASLPRNDVIASIRRLGWRKAKQSRKLACSTWRFNAWGHKYKSFEKDNLIPEKIAGFTKAKQFPVDMVLESGSIDVNGLGSCLATEQCLLNPNRNPSLGRNEIEQYLSAFLGIRHMIWLHGGIAGDDTDGHVDEVARFVGPKSIVYASPEDSSNENFDTLQKNLKCLCDARNQKGDR